MPDLSSLEARIQKLEQQTGSHKSQLREHKEWRDNQQGDGNIRVENGRTVFNLRASGFNPNSSTATTGTLSNIIIIFAGVAYYNDLNGTTTGPV